MANVYLTCESSVSDNPFARRDYERMIDYYSADKINKHVVCDDPALADIVAFIGAARVNFSDITSSSIYKKYRDKAVIFYSGDYSVPIIPGVYTCLENRLTNRYRKTLLAGFYLRVTDNSSMDIDEDIDDAEYLFSFVGNAKNHPVRERICKLPPFRAYLRDSSVNARQQDDGVAEKNRDRGELYRNVMANSKFSLCPRGLGVSSWRLFETMRAGRVPVIISDDWVAPKGPRWESFSLRIRESQVASIPDVLMRHESQAVELGATARKEWESWYSRDVVFSTLVDQLLLVQSAVAGEKKFLSALTYAQYFELFFLRHWVLSPLKRHIVDVVLKWRN